MSFISLRPGIRHAVSLLILLACAFPAPVAAFSLGSAASGALSSMMSSPYGGLVLMTIPCTCNENPAEMAIILGSPFPGTYFVDPTSITPYAYYDFMIPSVWHLGHYKIDPEAECWVGIEPYCYMIPITRGTITDTGASMPGAGGGGSSSAGASTFGGSGAGAQSSKGGVCNSEQNDAYTRAALKQYGGNLMSGNVKGLSSVCPNYQNLSQGQREAFWTQFVGSVEKPESNCSPTNRYLESNGQWSEGLLQLSVGDSARGHSGACNLTSSNIVDAKTNITCGVAIMDGLAPNGITNGNKGMDAYWSTLRSSSKSVSAINAQMSSFPGCK